MHGTEKGKTGGAARNAPRVTHSQRGKATIVKGRGATDAVAVLATAQTGDRWRRELRRLAAEHGCVVASEVVVATTASTASLPWALQTVLRADGWRREATVTEPSKSATSAGATPPALAVLLGVDAADVALGRAFPQGVVYATASGRPVGGNADLLAEVARGIPTTCIEVWWARATDAPVCVLRSIGMMRSGVARINDDLFATRVAELLWRGVRRVLEAIARAPEAPAVAAAPLLAGGDTDVLTRAARSDSDRAVPLLLSTDAARLLTRRVRTSVAARAHTRVWGIGYRRSRDEDAITSFSRVAESEWLVAPRGVTWADPFPVHAQGVDLLFFEEQRSLAVPGRLLCAELRADGRLTEPVPILDASTHRSYPNVFAWQGAWFLVPECAAERIVPLYRAVDFPYRWQHECDLIVGEPLVDATLLEHEGRWYLFATRIAADDVALEDLVCYVAPTLIGPWQPHVGNPVVSDAYRGRPAGQFLREGARLLRPAQDSSVTYGHGVSLQQVTALSAERYAEHTLVHRTADWAPDVNGLHTFNRSATLTCIDVARRVRS